MYVSIKICLCQHSQVSTLDGDVNNIINWFKVLKNAK